MLGDAFAQLRRAGTLVREPLANDVLSRRRLDLASILFYLHSHLLCDHQPNRNRHQGSPRHPTCIERHGNDAIGYRLFQPKQNGDRAKRFRDSGGDAVNDDLYDRPVRGVDGNKGLLPNGAVH